jgi:hypothetical protein
MGKAYLWDGSPMGESFQDAFLKPNNAMPQLDPLHQRYKHISNSESLMPQGFYSWWGITLTSSDKERLPDHLFNPPMYMQSPPKSLYGNREFSGDICKLLQCYQTSHRSKKLPDVYLLQGGTLRYSHEICYVVIVCTGELPNSLKGYPPLHCSSVLDPCGLTDVNGKVIDFSGKKTPIFHPKNLSTTESWESLAFAFYFHSAEQGLWCNKEHLAEGTISHNIDCCLKKVSPKRYAKRVCPNNLYI